MTVEHEVPGNVFGGWTILIIDDEPDSLIVAEYVLSFYGASVETVSNGRDGLLAAKASLPQFIISDLSMPIMDGWEFLRELRGDPITKAIPVIALTAHAMVGDRERVLGAGFSNYLTKPLSALTFISELVEIVAGIPQLAGKITTQSGGLI